MNPVQFLHNLELHAIEGMAYARSSGIMKSEPSTILPSYVLDCCNNTFISRAIL